MRKYNLQKKTYLDSRYLDTAFKYGVLGRGVRRKLDDCVVALILKHFQVEAGKRPRSYKAVAEETDNNDT